MSDGPSADVQPDPPSDRGARPPADVDHVVHPRVVPPERLKALTDGTVAIVLTLMVLEFRLPDGVSPRDLPAVRVALLELIPVLMAYLAAFCTVASMWLSHATMLHGVHSLRRRTAWATLGHLFFLCLIPFPMYLINRVGWSYPAAAMILVVVIGMASTTLGLARMSLVAEMGSYPALMRTLRLRVLVSVTIYVAALGLAAMVDRTGPAALFAAALAPLSYRFLGRRAETGPRGGGHRKPRR